MGSSTEDGELEVTEHRAEVRQRTHTHKDDRRQQSGLDEAVVQVVHYAEFVGDVVKRHVPDAAHGSVGQCDHARSIGLDYAHLSAGEIGNQHAEGDGNQQQGLVFLYDSQVEKTEGDKVHQQERRVLSDVAYGCHLIESIEYISHIYLSLTILTITSSSSTVSPLCARMAAIVPSKSAQMALLIFIASI